MTPAVRDRFEQALVAIILVGASIALFRTAPVGGDFWWSDAPRHALNGAFVKDFIAAAPWHDPKSWAINYYLQYPALTILFYPPLFYAIEAVGYALFGVSHPVAQATVSMFTLLLAAATYGLLRFNFPRWSALGASLLVIGGPETAFWARQVMLDVPAYAAVISGVFFFVRYLRGDRPADLFLAVIAILCAVYIKISAVFIAPVLAVALVAIKGPSILRQRHAIAAATLGVLGLVPAVLLTVKFGSVNVESVAGRSTDLPRTSLAAWLFYAETIPQYLGYVATVLAVCGLILVLSRRSAPLEPWFAWLLVGWLVFGYLFFSAIGVREPRHGIMIAFPLTVFAVLALHRALPQGIAPPAVAGLGFAVFLYSLLLYPAPRIEGYANIADYVAQHAPKNAVVLFSGYRDGNFIFDLRTHEERRDISTIRADKLLLRIAVERVRGVAQADLDEKQIADALREYGISLIVFQPDFWTDLREMARLSAVLHTPDFDRVASFDITGTTGHSDERIEIYKPTYPVEQTRRALQLQMPIIGESIKGDVGSH
ncbi:MAG TPA: glycosyltransferase family 39 protein [Stellaceae bacterium]|nr:glycosyltransferase family 39 protein [Stellaceae bacterium]